MLEVIHYEKLAIYQAAINTLGLRGKARYNGIEVLPATYATQVEAKVAELQKIEDVREVEKVFASQLIALRKRSASSDGGASRRLSDIGMKAQLDADSLRQSAISLGIIKDTLSAKDKKAIAMTVAYDTLIIKGWDKLSKLALEGGNYKAVLEKVKNVDLSTFKLTQANLDQLYTEFGITK
jgi:hypothetical protein